MTRFGLCTGGLVLAISLMLGPVEAQDKLTAGLTRGT